MEHSPSECLLLTKTIYGLVQSAACYNKKFTEVLVDKMGFEQCKSDPCLFMKKNMIYVVYTDDTIICGPDGNAIEAEILGIGVSKEKQRHTFELRDEGKVGDFLGIRNEMEFWQISSHTYWTN